eukprot:10134894-Alexandrium_andersonii.AAC.1
MAKSVQTEELNQQLAALATLPPAQEEDAAARRALVRYGKADDAVAASEDWVRLYIALRRTGGSDMRITPGILKSWKTK